MSRAALPARESAHRAADPRRPAAQADLKGDLIAAASIFTRKIPARPRNRPCLMRVIGNDGEPVPGLYAAGEVAGFGGGGMHGYRALRTFAGACSRAVSRAFRGERRLGPCVYRREPMPSHRILRLCRYGAGMLRLVFVGLLFPLPRPLRRKSTSWRRSIRCADIYIAPHRPLC